MSPPISDLDLLVKSHSIPLADFIFAIELVKLSNTNLVGKSNIKNLSLLSLSLRQTVGSIRLRFRPNPVHGL